jgi:hypothetical protein
MSKHIIQSYLQKNVTMGKIISVPIYPTPPRIVLSVLERKRKLGRSSELGCVTCVATLGCELPRHQTSSPPSYVLSPRELPILCYPRMNTLFQIEGAAHLLRGSSTRATSFVADAKKICGPWRRGFVHRRSKVICGPWGRRPTARCGENDSVVHGEEELFTGVALP